MAVTGTPGIKFSVYIAPDANDEDLLFAKQVGVNHVFTWVKSEGINERVSLFYLRKRVESFGLTLYSVGLGRAEIFEKIHLNLPGRDEAIEEYKNFLRNLGGAGVNTTAFAWEAAGTRTTSFESVRGGALARSVDMRIVEKEPQIYERTYTEKDIWDNFAYFVERVMPVAEEAGVRIALHPNDPPAPVGCIPPLIHSFESYEKAFAIADSANLGMEFCTGCWLEGGKNFGDMLEAIRYFVEKDRIFIVHFRNVSSPLPNFVETFIDDGYMDMFEVMKVFRDTGYDGTMICDHVPRMDNDPGYSKATAYAIGYMKALLKCAQSENKR
jgi:mannonate dehydratase